MHKSHMEFKKEEGQISFCHHHVSTLSLQNGLWAKFFFARFWSTQPCQDP
jgi:hypothetical protein